MRSNKRGLNLASLRMCWTRELKPHHGTNHLVHAAYHQPDRHDRGGVGWWDGWWARWDIAEAGLKQAGDCIERYNCIESLHPHTFAHHSLQGSHFVQNCQNVRLTKNDVQQYTMLGVAALLASLLLQICPDWRQIYHERKWFCSVDWFIESRSNIIASLYARSRRNTVCIENI